jgi:hypothetical protein
MIRASDRLQEESVMNYGRLALTAVIATVVDIIYGYAVYGTLLTSEFAKYPNLFRPTEVQLSYLPMMFAGFLVGMFAISWMYAKGYEGGNGIQEGMRFGFLVAVFVIAYMVAGNYAVMNLGRRISAYLALAALVEWLIVGMTIGAVYKPAAGAATRGRSAAGL